MNSERGWSGAITPACLDPARFRLHALSAFASVIPRARRGRESWIARTAVARRWVRREATPILAFAVALLCGLSPAEARCHLTGQSMTSEMVNAFVANPTSLLALDANTKNKEDAMVSLISAYLAYRADALDSLTSIIPQASHTQARAIGRGLFRVRFECAESDGALAARAEKLAQASGGKLYATYHDEEALFAFPTNDQQPVVPARRPIASSTTLPIIQDMGPLDPNSPTLSNPFVLPRLQ